MGGGLFTLQNKLWGDGILHVKSLKNIMCDAILHVNMFIVLRSPLLHVHFFTKFTYNEYKGAFTVRVLLLGQRT